MKSFLEHLVESEKTYDFRIKIANIDPKEFMDRLENALDAYGLDSVAGPKRLPIRENDIDFPSIKNCQIYLIDVVLKYPVNDAQLRALVADRAAIPLSNIVVVPTGHPEELWREDRANSDIREFKQGESVLARPEDQYNKPVKDTPYEDNPAGKEAGKVYAKAGSLLKELNKVKWDIAKESGAAAGKTTNDLPVNNNSPIKGQH